MRNNIILYVYEAQSGLIYSETFKYYGQNTELLCNKIKLNLYIKPEKD